MEPRSFNRGDLAWAFVKPAGMVASMEPRSFNRGDLLGHGYHRFLCLRFNGATVV